jgi:hypothetical protein
MITTIQGKHRFLVAKWKTFEELFKRKTTPGATNPYKKFPL